MNQRIAVPRRSTNAFSRERLARLVLCLGTMALAGAYAAPLSLRGWIPFDDGGLAHAAQRVLEGQLPHRDFDEIYSGGLSLMHALAFRVAGSDLATMRLTLFTVAIASLPAWYYVALRFATPLVAALITLTCFIWSVPMYPASMPSWYNLILAICAVAAALKYLENGRSSWIFLAGLLAGLSTLVKIAGFFLLASLILFTTYRLASTNDDRRGRAARDWFPLLIPLSLTSFLACAPFALVATSFDWRDAVELALPPALMSASVFLYVARRARDGWAPRFASVVRGHVWLGAGFGAPILIFLMPYWRSGALVDLWRGVFVLPQVRLSVASARMPAPEFQTMAAGLLVLWLVMRAPVVVSRHRSVGTVAAVVYGVTCASAALSDYAARALWLPLRMSILPLAVFAAVSLIRGDSAQVLNRESIGKLVLLTTAMSWCALVQFPYSDTIYFCYIAPLVILALVASLRASKLNVALPLIVLGCLVAGVRLRPVLNPSWLHNGSSEKRYLTLSRGHIWVPPDEYREYSDAVSLLRANARSEYTLALPELPGIYYLSGLENPTRTLYDAFDVAPGRETRLLGIIDSLRIDAVVVNHDPHTSAPISVSLSDSLTRRFPLSRSFGTLEVRWRSR